ncbi:MAG: hypothetical protein KGD64_07695, partial [Candidatus Heimdallarchaeota archaeon]|nr:hypothetical protein [Candidatus Heimdallarchaeota archaeon]
MTVYISTHYNFSRFLDPVPLDEYDKYTKIIQWFLANRSAKGTISVNSLFVLSNMWGNKTIIKNLSKLCLAGQLELSSSMYSSYIPLNLPSEERFIEHQISNASNILNDIFPPKYILYEIIRFYLKTFEINSNEFTTCYVNKNKLSILYNDMVNI